MTSERAHKIVKAYLAPVNVFDVKTRPASTMRARSSTEQNILILFNNLIREKRMKSPPVLRSWTEVQTN